MTTKKPSDLRIRRGKKNVKPALSKLGSQASWYATAASRIGITRDRREGLNPPDDEATPMARPHE